MSLTFGLQNPRDLLDKLKRDAALLEEEVTSDRFFNFVVTGYSIVDWLKHEPSVPQAATLAMYKDRWIKICGDLATASKHFFHKVAVAAFRSVNMSHGRAVNPVFPSDKCLSRRNIPPTNHVCRLSIVAASRIGGDFIPNLPCHSAMASVCASSLSDSHSVFRRLSS